MLNIAIQAAILAAALQAPAADRQPDVRVSYADLDLSRPEDARLFDRRIEWAVRDACPSSHGVSGVARMRPILACRAAKRAEVEPLRQTALAAAAARSQTALAKAR
jgi:UrcA family protein